MPFPRVDKIYLRLFYLQLTSRRPWKTLFNVLVPLFLGSANSIEILLPQVST